MKKFISILLCLALCFALMIPISAAAQGDVIELKVYEDLLKIKDNPSGSYKLMYDIDCAGHEWTPVDFSGNFDGNGHALLNLKITGTTTDVRTTIDGNWKQYDTYFSGFFGIVENATIENLSLLGVDADVTKNDNIYAAGLVGFMSDSTIKNCTVEGKVCLHTACKAFGVAGILGYGWGSVDSCTADVTVICVDTDKENRDEQFLGGIFGNGYPDITNCTVTIEGYDSDHGYVHDGGIGGMWILPGGVKHDGHIDNNTVKGAIHFFEDNTNRRAYCIDKIGEIMSWTITQNGNKTEFTRDETKDYSKDLYPEMCENSEYDKQVVDATDNAYGYTIYKCKTCDYSYKANYTSLNVFVEPVPEEETTASKPANDKKDTSNFDGKLVYIIMAAVIILGIVITIIVLNARAKAKRRRELAARRAARRGAPKQ